MKRKIVIIALLYIGAACLLPACDIFDECGVCEMVTVNLADNTETRTAPVPLCGEDLEDKKNFVPKNVDGTSIYWECN